jgi:hypothetical protein
MLEIPNNELELLSAKISDGDKDSEFGFFSKPFRINLKNKELIIKNIHLLRIRQQSI